MPSEGSLHPCCKDGVVGQEGVSFARGIVGEAFGPDVLRVEEDKSIQLLLTKRLSQIAFVLET
eukprot:5541307-Ditylum_brightwellii.AAC.1